MKINIKPVGEGAAAKAAPAAAPLQVFRAIPESAVYCEASTAYDKGERAI